MRSALLVLAALSAISLPAANAQVCGDEGRYFHLRPPAYSIPRHRKQCIHRWAKALRWYKEHNGDKPLCTK
jgi:hypothetical protein